MTIWLLIGGLTVTTYLLRLGGVALAARRGARTNGGSVADDMVALLPTALLAAVAATQIVPKGNISPPLLCAALAAGTAATRLAFLPAVLIGGGIGALVTWW
ncbi:AzlD domain-containing protein [Actinomadura kijaniata]|uniref:AzlD domain-containing protein n=1 Tax=Actinomadura kijaniata TaxID=46161 RepID=UPI003F19F8C2